MKIHYIYLFQFSILLFGLSSIHIAESDANVCDNLIFAKLCLGIPGVAANKTAAEQHHSSGNVICVSMTNYSLTRQERWCSDIAMYRIKYHLRKGDLVSELTARLGKWIHQLHVKTAVSIFYVSFLYRF